MQIGPYDVHGELGRGGMGVVYRARHRELGHDVALKLLSPSLGSSAGTGGVPPTRSGDTGMPLNEARWIERFRREAQAAGRLGTQPGIVGVLDVGEDEGRLYLAMQLIEGHALDAEVRGRVLEPADAFTIVGAVARAVEFAHAQGIIHRDLKPGNILIDHDRGVWVTDFGLAARTVLDDESQRITRTNDVVGTPAYLAPEQLRGEPVDARTDIHALGCTLYELLTGATPFESRWLPVTCRRVLQDEPAPPSAQLPELGADVDAVVLRCLEKDPADRYPSAAALAEDCERIARGEAPLTRPPSPGRRVWRWMRRRGTWLVIAALVLIVASGLVWYAAAGGGTQARDQQLTETTTAGATATQAGDIGSAFGGLQLATRSAMRLLEDRWHGAPVDAAAVRDAAAEVAAAVAHDPRPFARAWGQLAVFFRGDEAGAERALAALAETAGDDPVPAALLAQIRLEWLLRDHLMPTPQIHGTQVLITFSRDPLLEIPLYQSALAAMKAARAKPTWSRLADGSGLPDFLDAADAVLRMDSGRAIALLQPLQDDAFFGGSAQRLLGVARFAATDPAGAAEAFRALGRSRGWREAYRSELDACAVYLAAFEAGPERAAMEARADALVAILQSSPMAKNDWVAVARLQSARAGNAWRNNVALGVAFAPPLETLRRCVRDHDGYGAVSLGRLLLAMALFRGATPDEVRERLRELEALQPVLQRFEPDIARVWALRSELRRLSLPSVAGARPIARWTSLLVRAAAEVRREPRRYEAHRLLIEAHLALGRVRMVRGDDPTGDFERTVEAIAAARRRWPSESDLLRDQIRLLLVWAQFDALRGGDPTPRYEAGEGATDRYLERYPESWSVWESRGRLYHGWAEWKRRRGIPADADWARALRALDSAVAFAPFDVSVREQRGMSRMARGQHRMAAGLDPSADFDRAEADFGMVAESGVLGGLTWMQLGRLFRLRAEFAQTQGLDPREFYAESVKAMDKAVALSPRWGEAYFNRGVVWLRFAIYVSARRIDPRKSLELAVSDFTRALDLMPRDADALANRGAAKATQGDTAQRAGHDPKPYWLAAIADLQAAAAINPSLWQLHVNAAMLYESMGRDDDALAAYDAALRINPNATQVAAMAAALRKRLGR